MRTADFSNLQLGFALLAYREGHENKILNGLQEEANIAAAESGADREPDHDPESYVQNFAENWFGEWLAGKPLDSTLYGALVEAYDATESWVDDSVGAQLVRMVLHCIQFTMGRNTAPPDRCSEVLRVLTDVTECTDLDAVMGAELAYLVLAMLTPGCVTTLWDLQDPEGMEYYGPIRELFRKLFHTGAPVWNHIEILESTTPG